MARNYVLQPVRTHKFATGISNNRGVYVVKEPVLSRCLQSKGISSNFVSGRSPTYTLRMGPEFIGESLLVLLAHNTEYTRGAIDTFKVGFLTVRSLGVIVDALHVLLVKELGFRDFDKSDSGPSLTESGSFFLGFLGDLFLQPPPPLLNSAIREMHR